MSSFGERFRQLRLQKGMTQQELIDEFNKKYDYSFGKTTISQYENNKRIPEITTLQKLSEYFSVSIDYLLGMTDYPYITSRLLREDNTNQDIESIKNAYENLKSKITLDNSLSVQDKETLIGLINVSLARLK